MSSYRTLTDILIRVSGFADRGITFIDDKKEEFLSYADLYRQALGLLHVLQEKGINPDDEVLLQLPDPKEFLVTFWACMLGGIVPIPVDARTKHDYMMRLFRIWKTLRRSHLIAGGDHLRTLNNFAFENDLMEIFEEMQSRSFAIADLVPQKGREGKVFNATPGKLAYIQYSSGTVGEPRGVTLTHENLVTNIVDIYTAALGTEKDRTLSWLPLTHDMGLIGFHLTPMATLMNQYLMHTHVFVMQPRAWLKKIAEHGVTITVSPNFGYKYYLSFFDPAVDRGIDLSTVRIIFNGAEPISLDLCNRFLDALGPCGLKRTVIFPVYGLAEASLAVSFPVPHEEIVSYSINRFSLEMGRSVEDVPDSDRSHIRFVDLGTPLPGTQVRIADADGAELPENALGHILIRGKNVSGGYYLNGEETARAFTGDGWLRTGDMGFMRNGRLVVTGREKDILFVNGQNYYAHDIERIVEGVRGIVPGSVAAVGAFNDAIQEDEIIVFIKEKNADLAAFAGRAMEVQKSIYMHLGIKAHHILPLERIPITTSGKIQRSQLRRKYIEGVYEDLKKTLRDMKHTTLTDHIAGANETEVLAKMISRYLLKRLSEELEDVIYTFDDDTDLFDLGIDSLTLARLLIKLEEEVGVSLEALYFLEVSNIRQIALNLANEYREEFSRFFAAKEKVS